ncbi:MAG TPA: hypothetical protein VMN38_02180 [Sphingomicrobium sp.]|nr:hypothetical protein [Sphingomicrobium sp.]
MNWIPLFVAFGLAVLAGAWANARLASRKPTWSIRRRVFTASTPLPAIVVVASAIGVGWYVMGSSENMRDLAIAVVIGVGAIFAAVTLAGGLIGAVMVEKGRER